MACLYLNNIRKKLFRQSEKGIDPDTVSRFTMIAGE